MWQVHRQRKKRQHILHNIFDKLNFTATQKKNLLMYDSHERSFLSPFQFLPTFINAALDSRRAVEEHEFH